MIFEPFEILTLLSAAGVEYIVVGGMAGLLHMSSVLTQDLDIVHGIGGTAGEESA